MVRSALPDRARWGVTVFAAAVATVLVAAVALVGLVASAPAASAQSGYTVSISDGEVDPASGQTTVILRLVPGSTGIGAISVDIVIDQSMIRVTDAQALIGSGTCAAVNDSARFAGLDVNGWSAPIDLCEITVTRVATSGVTPITPVVTVAVDVQTNPQPLNGSAVAGSISLGSPAPVPTSTRPPTTVATATPEPEPTAEPEPTDVPEDQEEPTEVPAEPTAAPLDTSDDDPSDDGPSGTEPGDGDADEADPDPTPDPIAEPTAEPADAAAPLDEAAEGDDRGARATSEPISDDDAVVGAESLEDAASEPAVDEESAAPILPEADESTDSAGLVQVDQDDLPPLSDENKASNTALLATVAIGLLVVGGGFAAATRRANRFND